MSLAHETKACFKTEAHVKHAALKLEENIKQECPCDFVNIKQECDSADDSIGLHVKTEDYFVPDCTNETKTWFRCTFCDKTFDCDETYSLHVHGHYIGNADVNTASVKCKPSSSDGLCREWCDTFAEDSAQSHSYATCSLSEVGNDECSAIDPGTSDDMVSMIKSDSTDTDSGKAKKQGCDTVLEEIMSENEIDVVDEEMNFSGPDKLYSCPDCTYSSTDQQRYLKHTTCAHTIHLCPHCNYRAYSKHRLKVHSMRHSGEKPFSCDDCSYSTSQMSNLRRHRKTHTKELLHVCKDCGHKCIQLRDFEAHCMSKHKGKFLYSCDQCAYSSSWKSHLTRHKMNIHEKGREPQKKYIIKENASV